MRASRRAGARDNDFKNNELTLRLLRDILGKIKALDFFLIKWPFYDCTMKGEVKAVMPWRYTVLS